MFPRHPGRKVLSWSREYLQGLKEYQRKVSETERVPEIGEIVLVVDNSMQKRNWRMGRIVDHIKSTDGMIRAIKLHVLSQGNLIELQRPLQSIASLEFQRRTKRLATFVDDKVLDWGGGGGV